MQLHFVIAIFKGYANQSPSLTFRKSELFFLFFTKLFGLQMFRNVWSDVSACSMRTDFSQVRPTFPTLL